MAPVWLYHLNSEIRNVRDEKAKLYTLSKVLYTQSMIDEYRERREKEGKSGDLPDELVGDRNGFYFGIYMICCKNNGKMTREEYLEAVGIINFIVADFRAWKGGTESKTSWEYETWKGRRSLGATELEAATREEAWEAIEGRDEDDELKKMHEIAEDLYLELGAIVDRKTDILKIIDNRPGRFRYYRANNDATIEEILKLDYKGVKVLTPGKEQEVIQFLWEIAKGRTDETGENISLRENDAKYIACKADKMLVAKDTKIPLTREIYTSLVYDINSFRKE